MHKVTRQQLPQEILLTVLRELEPTPVDLVRLGAGIGPAGDALAIAARDSSLWRSFSPPGALSHALQIPLHQAFAVRLQGMGDTTRRATLRLWGPHAALAADTGFPASAPSPLLRGSEELGALFAFDFFRAKVEYAIYLADPSDLEDEPLFSPNNRQILQACPWLQDRDVMGSFVGETWHFFAILGDNLFADRDFLVAALSHYEAEDPCHDLDFPLDRVHETLLEQKPFVQHILTLRPLSYRFLAEPYKRSKDLFLFTLEALVTRYPSAESMPLESADYYREDWPWNYASDIVRNDRQVALRAIALHHDNYFQLGDELQHDRTIVRALLQRYSIDEIRTSPYQQIDSNFAGTKPFWFFEDEELMLFGLRSAADGQYFGTRLLHNKSFYARVTAKLQDLTATGVPGKHLSAI